MARAITWEAAHKDIEQQKTKQGELAMFNIEGFLLEPPKGSNYFRDDAPPEIKALANNINDRTNPLWDIAIRYTKVPKNAFRLKSKQFQLIQPKSRKNDWQEPQLSSAISTPNKLLA